MKPDRTWQRPPHLQVSVISVMDLCLHVPPGPGVIKPKGGTFPEIASAVQCLFACHAPTDELRFWVAVYERLKRGPR